MGHSGKESPRQRELKAVGLTWGTATKRAQEGTSEILCEPYVLHLGTKVISEK